MATVNCIEELIAWQKARLLSNAVFRATRAVTFKEDIDLKRQIRRAGGSVMDNIAEGFGRGNRGEFIQFLGIAKGSAVEVKSQLYRSLDNELMTPEQFDTLYQQTDEVCRLIDGLLLYLNASENKGRRYAKGQPKPTT